MSVEKQTQGAMGASCAPMNDVMTGVACGMRLEKAPVLIVFDLDGTISDSAQLGRELFKQVFALMGYGTISDELADSFNGPSADEVCRVMNVSQERRALYNELLETIEDDLVQTIGRLFPGVDDMLKTLSGHAVLALLTNGTQRYCETTLRTFSLSQYIRLHSGYVHGVTKAQRMQIWAQEIGARRIVCVGDRGTDIANGHAVGALTIGVTYGMGERTELAQADVLCDTPQEVTAACLRAIEAC